MKTNDKKWTVGKSSWVHSPGFIWAIYWSDSERGSFKSEQEAQEYCDYYNKHINQ